PASTYIYPLSLHDALPISLCFPHGGGAAIAFIIALIILFCEVLLKYFCIHFVERRPAQPWRRGFLVRGPAAAPLARARTFTGPRSEEHTSELQSRFDLVCR